jgi:hypothetical protein
VTTIQKIYGKSITSLKSPPFTPEAPGGDPKRPQGRGGSRLRNLVSIPTQSATRFRWIPPPPGEDKRPLVDRRNGATRRMVDFYHKLQQLMIILLLKKSAFPLQPLFGFGQGSRLFFREGAGNPALLKLLI